MYDRQHLQGLGRLVEHTLLGAFSSHLRLLQHAGWRCHVPACGSAAPWRNSRPPPAAPRSSAAVLPHWSVDQRPTGPAPCLSSDAVRLYRQFMIHRTRTPAAVPPHRHSLARFHYLFSYSCPSCYCSHCTTVIFSARQPRQRRHGLRHRQTHGTVCPPPDTPPPLPDTPGSRCRVTSAVLPAAAPVHRHRLAPLPQTALLLLQIHVLGQLEGGAGL